MYISISSLLHGGGAVTSSGRALSGGGLLKLGLGSSGSRGRRWSHGWRGNGSLEEVAEAGSRGGCTVGAWGYSCTPKFLKKILRIYTLQSIIYV